MQQYKLMKALGYFLAFIFICGCASLGTILIPTESGDDEYWMFYDRSKVSIPRVGDISNSARNEIYENRITLILQSDPAAASCNVIEGSVNFGEPGSGGSVKVKCSEAIPLQRSGLFEQDGSPIYRYFLSDAHQE